MFRKIKWALTASALSLVASCGGNGSTVSQNANGWQVNSGIAQKGPLLRGSSVTVAELSTTTLQPSGKTYPFEVLDDSGTFKPTNVTFTSSFLESTALGYYFNELTGVRSLDMVFLRGLSNLASGQDTAVNVNVLSSFTNQRIKNLFNTAPKKTFAVARPQAEKELLAGFFIYNAVDLMPGTTVGGVLQPKTFMELDLSKKRAADQILAAMSAVIVNAGQTGSGVNYLINQIEMDLADDGLMNNSTKFAVSVASQLNAAVQTTDFAAAALNLNSFYGTSYTGTDFSQWIDTSGGVDKVINKFKFSSTNVVIGVESKSPAYLAGTEDAGQCISVSAGKLYRNGTLVTAATVKAIKGDSYVIGLVPATAGITLNGFIQRSAPVNGVCPPVVPLSKLTRVQKYNISNTKSISSIFAGNLTMHAITTDGLLFGWGENGSGETGNGQSANIITSPVLIGSSFAKVAQGQQQGVAIKTDGTLWLYGGWGSFTNTFKPNLIDSNYYSAIAAGGISAFAIRSDNTLWAIGSNYSGQLGTGLSGDSNSLVQIGIDYSKISTDAQGGFILAIKTDGSLWAWGHNDNGQYGNGTTTTSSVPIKTDNGPWMEIATMTGSSFGLKPNGTLWAWGWFGNKFPTQIGRGTYKKISAGNGTLAAIDNNGYLWTLSTVNPIPTQFDNNKYLDVSVGFPDGVGGPQTIISIRSDGTVWTWGSNNVGQLGIGNTNVILSPVQVIIP